MDNLPEEEKFLNKNRRKIITGIILMVILLLIGSGIFFFFGSVKLSSDLATAKAQILGADTALDGTLIVNIPSTFNQNIKLNDKNLDAGNGKVFASNLIYSLQSGVGISIDASQNPTITNTDPGSAQNMFKNVSVNGQFLSAGSNNATLRFISNGGLSLQNGQIVVSAGASTSNVVNNITNNNNNTTSNTTVTDASLVYTGLQNLNNNVSLINNNDTLSFGTAVKDGKLNVMGTSNQIGLVVQADTTQNSSLSQWRDANGNPLVTFDIYGNAVYKGNIVQNGFTFTNNTIKYTDPSSNMVLDLNTPEPTNLLLNPGVNVNLANWQSDQPIAQNQALNPGLQTDLSNWNSTVEGVGYPNLFNNPGFEVDTGNWTFFNDTVTISQYTVPTANSTPQRLITAPDGNRWFIEESSPKIGMVTSNGTITEYTIGSQIVSIVVGPDNNLWALDSQNNQLIKVGLNGGVINRYNLPQFGNPANLVVGGDSNLWLAYLSDREIARVTTSGVATYFSTGGSFQPAAMALGSDNNVWVVPLNGCGIGKITQTGTFSILSGSWCINKGEITSGPDGNLYVSSIFDVKIFKFTTSGVLTNIGIPNGFQQTLGINFSADGKIWLGQWNGNDIHSYILSSDVLTSDTIYNVPNNTAIGNQIAFDSSGNVWFTEPNENRVSELVLTSPQSRVTSPTHSFSAGALNVNALANVNVVQGLTLASGKIYTLTAYVNNNGNSVDPVVAQLYVGNQAVSTTYTVDGNGWYKLTANVIGTGVLTNYGLKVYGGNNVFVDDLALNQFSGAFHVFSQFYTSSGSAEIDAPPASSVVFYQNSAFNSGTYTIVFYAYKDGTAVTSSDVEIMFNGTAQSTTISTTGKAGWYQVSSTFATASLSANWGIRVKSNRTIFVDDASLLLGTINQAVLQTTTAPIYEGTGDVEINAIGLSQVYFYQSYTVTVSDNYVLYAYIYNETPGQVGGTIDASKVVLAINGSPASTTYSAGAGGWYQVLTQQTLSPGTYTLGVKVQSGFKVRADAFAFQVGSGTNKTFSVTNSGSGLAFLDVESTSTLHSGLASRQSLIIQGSQNQSANLTEWQDSSASVLSVVDSAGRFGIGTTTPSRGLVVLGSNNGQSPVAFVNTSATDNSASSVLKLATATPNGGTATRFIQFYAGATNESNGTGVGRIRLNNGGVAYESGGADFAEYFAKETGETFEAGNVVNLNSSGKITKENTGLLLGAISDTAAFVGNSQNENDGSELVGLIGQMSIKVTTTNGKISKGDFITSSANVGFAQKSTADGMVYGVALEDFDVTSLAAESCGVYECGKIKVYIQPHWVSTSATISAIASNLISQNQDGVIELAGGKATIDKLGNFVLAAGNLNIEKGVLSGNNNFNGKVTLPKGQTQIVINKTWTKAPSSVNATPLFDASVWITDITGKGFTLNVSKASDSDEFINWFAIF